MLAIRLDGEMERRLEALAERTGRTKTFYAREAIETHLRELEDFYLAEERLRSFRGHGAASVAGPVDADAHASLIESLRRLWVQGEASGVAVEGNFDATDIARRGAARLAAARRDD